MSISVKAWWLSSGKLGYSDDRRVRVGSTHKVKGELRMCENGLHGSRNILDALGYGRGKYIYRTDHGGEIIQGDDKLCSSERTYLWRVESEQVLRKFARMCALDVIHLWDAPKVVVEYLKTGAESKRDAARAEARAAEWAAAGAAARGKQAARLVRLVMAEHRRNPNA